MTNRRPQLGDRSASGFGKEATLGKYGRSVGGRFPSRRVSSGLQGAELSTYDTYRREHREIRGLDEQDRATLRREASDYFSERMKRQIILSVDHEIFGNGTGDVRRHMTEPAELMARTCEKHGMPLTVFFEVEEYMAFGRERERLVAVLGYDPEKEVRDQAVDFAKRGHDLQLHVHPEWVGATFHGESWQLRPDRRTVDSLFETLEETIEYIRSRKAVLDKIWEEAGSDRRVTAFRAGAFCAQPGSKLLPALGANGIFVDSSLVKGMTRDDEHVHLDFRAAPMWRRHWRVSRDVACEDKTGDVLEIPIYSQMGRRIQQLTPRRLLAKFSGSVPKEKQREMVSQLGMGRSPTSVARFLAKPFPIKLDFHNMSARQMLRWILNAPPAPAGDLDVIMLIGHSKEHRDNANFDAFLAGVAANSSLEVISLNDFSAQLDRRGIAPLSPCSPT